MPNFSTENMRYEEYRAINKLLREHPKTHREKLRAAIVFGEMVATGNSQDINLLEVVEDWIGPPSIRFSSTEALPLRGKLNIYFLTPDQFENPRADRVPGASWSSAELLSQVRKGYAILTERPGNYAYDLLSSLEDTPDATRPTLSNEDPISFFSHLDATSA
ncbi:MAG TPA: hypothetical protein VFJ58_25360 [Armatimonadota bacterium]|nr:hypothetical protein [Armatimonadota bacterium]